MKHLKLFILTTVIIAGIISCNNKEKLDPNITGLGGDSWVPTAVDKWLYDSIVKPYNIEMKYKWDQSEFAMDLVLVPPYENTVVPVTRDIISMWITPYNQASGDTTFMKRNTPKQIMLSGSIALQTNGNAVAGLAEGGLKILLFGINSYSSKDSFRVADMAHLIHHEYTHILNQKKNYPIEFNKVTPDGYTGNWTVAEENPWTLGFVTNYARKEPGEDIAELVSTMLVMGRTRYDSTLYHPFPGDRQAWNDPNAIQLLRTKEKIVVDYFRESYNIDFYDLQTKVQQQIYKTLHQ
ncbi:MAG TPA: substrate import-associated zinc metallohydrolase lipoprotein [Chitinophaga sp.]|uniref:substrate import-associated zinc metallohydrolase lipoprotein n=1 Tax=Chitinophaga sp. TaxID=1869181 RepID=UPI002C441BA0|nr:substrate import-associated zinc metallohydrolase lipoprotein [Chitinophaga sp.]HVI46498.1 substrate import-associated zinc metallohydrolase lipoprotein [Chitinophaga sp.]